MTLILNYKNEIKILRFRVMHTIACVIDIFKQILILSSLITYDFKEKSEYKTLKDFKRYGMNIIISIGTNKNKIAR